MAEHQQAILNKARADKFLLVFSLPKVLKDLNIGLASPKAQTKVKEDSLQFSIWGSVVPAVSIPHQNLRWGGQPYNVTGQSRPEYAPIMVNFTIDNNFNNYWVLWKWMDKMNNIKNSGMDDHFADKNITNSLLSPHYTDYQTVMTVFAMDEYNKRVARFDYSNAFITDLGEINYNYRTENELESSFAFVFNQMNIILLTDGEPD